MGHMTIMPMDARKKRRHLAFGVESNHRRYRLRLARYAALAETLAAIADARGERAGAPLRLLDAGAGNGRTVRYLEPHGALDSFEFHAIEIDPHRIDRLYGKERWREIKNVDLTEGAPYQDEFFDVVVCEQVLEHLHDADSILKDLVRVLRPGGVLIIGVPTFPPGLATIRRRIVPLFDRIAGRERGHCQVFTAAGLRRFARSSGHLTIDQIRGFRVLSGGVLAPLENYQWWYRFNRRLGELAPALCVECQAIATKANGSIEDSSRGA